MKVFKKQETKEIVGRSKVSFMETKYIVGLPENFNSLKQRMLILEIREKGISLGIGKGFGFVYIPILDSDFNYVSVFSPEVKKKNKSVVGRAILGGLLLGPLGLVVGGMSGIGEKDLKGVENIITINITFEQKPISILLSCKNKHIKSFNKFLQKHIPEKIKQAEDVKEAKENTTSTADELIKLKKLMDDGILSKEEFETQKQKILNL